jgi:hypothetical protein
MNSGLNTVQVYKQYTVKVNTVQVYKYGHSKLDFSFPSSARIS